MHEMRFFTHCKIKKKDPKHTCTTKELAKNLKMSIRDVQEKRIKMTKQGKLTHEEVVYKSRRIHRFTPVDPRLYTSKDIISIYKNHVNEELIQIEYQADKMIKTPAYYDVEMKPILKPYPQPQIFMEGKKPMIPQVVRKASRPTQLSGKTNEQGFLYLEYFCNAINNIFAFCDSLGYSQLVNNIKQDEEHDKMIYELKKTVFHKTQRIIERVLKGLPYLQKYMISQAITPRIPMLYQMLQVERFSKL